MSNRHHKIPNRLKSANILLVDNVHSHRQYLISIFREAGMYNIFSAGSAEEAMTIIEDEAIDLIISEFDLGGEQNGIQFFETLKEKQIITPETAFIFLAAEMRRIIVMSAYDLEPDAYITKPISAKTFIYRVMRLLSLKDRLKSLYHTSNFFHHQARQPIVRSLDDNSLHSTVDFLNTTLASEQHPASRVRNACLKMLGDVYMNVEDYSSAELIYREVLETLPLDWAKVGMAKIKKAKNQTDDAIEDFQRIINKHPLCLEAYDQLSDLYKSTNSKSEMHEVISKAATLSPLSIHRQERLGEVALGLNDYKVSSSAYHSAVKLGRYSVCDKLSNYINFGRATNLYFQHNEEGDRDILQNAISAMSVAEERFDMTPEESAQLSLVQSQSFHVKGNQSLLSSSLKNAQEKLSALETIDCLETQIDLIYLHNTDIEPDELPKIEGIDAIVEKYREDQASLERLDQFLDEPISQANREFIAKINKEGIQYYEKKAFKQAVECFDQAVQAFPKYIPLYLNLVQALHGFCVTKNPSSYSSNSENKITEDPITEEPIIEDQIIEEQLQDNDVDEESAEVLSEKKNFYDRAVEVLQFVESHIEQGNKEYQRYCQLQDMIQKMEQTFQVH